MADYNNRDNRSGGKKFGGRNFGGGERDRDSERPTMHKAVCDDCGNSCQVPFRPSGDKPVFCSDCFRQNSKSNSSSFGERDSGERRSNNRDRGDRDSERERPAMHKAVCDECGNGCEVPFRPSGEKPVFCNDCFSKGGKNHGNKNSEQANEQFEMLNAKLDKILKMITPVIYKETPKKEKEMKEEVGVVAAVVAEEKAKTVKPKKAAKKAVKKVAKEV